MRLMNVMLLCASGLLAMSCGAREAYHLDLSGKWTVKGKGFDGPVNLPGTLTGAGYGAEQGPKQFAAYKGRQELMSPTRRRRYEGEAVYSRKFTVDAEAAGRPLEFYFERVQWVSRLRVDGKDVGGFCDSLGTPHVYAIPAGTLAPGEHQVEVVVDNTEHYGVGRAAHGYGDWMMPVWNGIIGEIQLREANPLRGARVFATGPANGVLRFEVPAGFVPTATNVKVKGLELTGFESGKSPYAEGRTLVTAKLAKEPELWSTHNPRLYVLELTDAATGFVARHRFGFRTIAKKGHQLLLNGVPFFVRANVDNGSFPLNAYPDMRLVDWKRTLRVERQCGMNALQFHTWTPPLAAFRAADEEGFVIFSELGYWGGNAGHGRKDVDDFLQRELWAVSDMAGNSPSFICTAFGNELGHCGFEAFDQWMKAEKQYDPRQLTMATTARKVVPSDEVMVTHCYPGVGMVREVHRPGTDFDYEERYSKCPIPVIAHEIGQWPVYPLWDEEMPKFNGEWLLWRWQQYRDRAAKNGVLPLARKFHMASIKTSRYWYKSEAEAFLRTKSCAGVAFLDHRDYVGQGEALVGFLDAFGDAKPGCSELSSFSTVMNDLPCLARFLKPVWMIGETFKVQFQVRNLTGEVLKRGATWRWAVGTYHGVATLAKDVQPDEIATVKSFELKLGPEEQLGKRVLRFGDNEWNIWVFPAYAKVEPPAGFLFTADFAKARSELAKGGKVLFNGPGRRSGRTRAKPVYWSTVLFPKWHSRFSSIGMAVECDHPALAGYPSDDWLDQNWRHLIDWGQAYRLEGMPSTFEPILTMVPDLHESTLMSPLFELNVGKGKLLVCGFDLSKETPEVASIRRSLFDYAASGAFQPKTTVDAAWFDDNFDPKHPRESDKLEGRGLMEYFNVKQ